MTPEDALKTLDLTEPFGPLELKRAFRFMAVKHHPDKNKSSEAAEVFQKCVSAYEILFKRLSDGDPNLPPPRVENLDDIFEDILGYSDESRILGYQEPEILEVSVNEFLFGVHRQQKLKVYEACEVCEGSGSKKGARAHLCAYCFGGGRIRSANDGEKSCPKCLGRGRTIDKPCFACNGFGRAQATRMVSVDLKTGFQMGHTQAFALTGLPQAKRMDLFLKPVFKNSQFFAVEKNQLVCHFFAPLTIKEVGGRIDFSSIWGWREIDIPKNLCEPFELTIDELGLPTSPNTTERGNLKLILEFVSEKKFLKMKQKFYLEVAPNNPHYNQSELKSSWWSRLVNFFS